MDIVSILTNHEQYKYILIFILAVPEGMILALTCGFLFTIGFLNPVLVYLLIVLGDAVMDSLFYSFGRLGTPFMIQFGHKIGMTPERMNSMRQQFESNCLKVIITSKLIHAPGAIGLMMAGVLRIVYPRFAVICLLVTLCRAGILFALGILFGRAYERIGAYFNYYTAGIVIVVLFAVVLYWRFKRCK